MPNNGHMIRALAISLLVSLGACSGGTEPPLRVGVNPWFGFTPLYLADERRLFDIVPLSVDEHAAAFSDGRVAFVVTFEPILSTLRGQGHVKGFIARRRDTHALIQPLAIGNAAP